MTQAARQVIDAFDALPAQEQYEILAELLRRAVSAPHELPSEDDLVALADQLFLELDREEQAG